MNTILIKLDWPFLGLVIASIAPAPNVKIKPYPASESIIPKNKKKKNATNGFGSISLYFGAENMFVTLSYGLTTSLFSQYVGTLSPSIGSLII